MAEAEAAAAVEESAQSESGSGRIKWATDPVAAAEEEAEEETVSAAVDRSGIGEVPVEDTQSETGEVQTAAAAAAALASEADGRSKTRSARRDSTTGEKSNRFE